MRSLITALLVGSLVALLSACGTKGPLVPPPGPAKPPLFGNPAPPDHSSKPEKPAG